MTTHEADMAELADIRQHRGDYGVDDLLFERLFALAERLAARVPQWRPIAELNHNGSVLVSRPTDSVRYRPTTAFKDVTGVWRVTASYAGMEPLLFDPTHFMPLPESPHE